MSNKETCPHCKREYTDLEKHITKHHAGPEEPEAEVGSAIEPITSKKAGKRRGFIVWGGFGHTKCIDPMRKMKVGEDMISSDGLDITFAPDQCFTWNSVTDGKKMAPKQLELVYKRCLEFEELKPGQYEVFDTTDFSAIEKRVKARTRKLLPVEATTGRRGARAGYRSLARFEEPEFIEDE